MKDKEANVLQQARKILTLPNTEDKAICFISSWERTRISLYMPAEEEEKEYVFQEMSLFETALRKMQENADLSFLAFREFSDDIDDEEIDFDEIRRAEKSFPIKKPKYESPLSAPTKEEFIEAASYKHALSEFLSRKSVAYLKYQKKMEDLVGYNVTILPKNDTSRKYVRLLKEEGRLSELQSLAVLGIDYNQFPYSVLYHFLNYMHYAYSKERKGYLEVQPELTPLYNLFSKVSGDVRIATYAWIEIWIDRAYNNKLTTKDWDNMEFVAMSHIQNIQTPYCWIGTYKDGYLCEENKRNSKPKGELEREDFRFFYSFESLLVYELKSCLKRIKRCINCGAILEGKTFYKGRYCFKGSANYKSCYAERNRKRQAKHYVLSNKNLTK